MSAVKPVLSPLTRAALEAEAHVATAGWGQQPRIFALARNGDLLRRQPGLRAVLGDVDPEEYSAIEQEGLVEGGNLEKALGHLGWPADVDGAALILERVIVPPSSATKPTPVAFGGTNPDVDSAAPQGDREDVRLAVAVLRNGEIITLVRRRAQDSDDKVAIGTNIAPNLIEALKATFA